MTRGRQQADVPEGKDEEHAWRTSHGICEWIDTALKYPTCRQSAAKLPCDLARKSGERTTPQLATRHDDQ